MSAGMLRRAAAEIALSHEAILRVADYLASFNNHLPDEVAVNEGDCEADCDHCTFAWKLARLILGEPK